ncbi:MAG TPA: hypothetical protein VG936_00645 [Lacunisphaera sp.]|nr:hypothetical protein [Lacunisphaera sp.]
MRSNRLLGSALIEHNLVKFEDLEAANERLLEIAATGDMRRSSVLSVLVYEKKVLREEDLLHHVVDDQGLGVVDLRGYDVPEEVKRDIEIEACWATWSVPFDKEEDFHFVATAYYLSPAARSYWEKKLGGQIIWQATTMDIIADFLDRLQAERVEAAKRGGKAVGTRAPFAAPASASSPPFPMAGTAVPFPPATGSAAPFAAAGGSHSPASSHPPVPPPPASSVPPVPS